MGLKEISFAPFKMGKTVHALSAVELGDVGYIDNEFHARPYLHPHATLKPRGKPFQMPMQTRTDLHMCQANPTIGQAFASRNTVYLFESMDFGDQMAAVEAFSNEPSIATIVLDSGSIIWDLLGDVADELNEESARKNAEKGRGDQSTLGRLAWNKPKKYNRRMFYACMRSGKHIIMTSHQQENWKEGGDGKLVLVGVKPWLEKKSPHWADLTVEFALPDAKRDTSTGDLVYGVPSVKVVGENLGGGPNGCFVKGTVIKNPTFKQLVDLSQLTVSAPVGLSDADEQDYRNRSVIERSAVVNNGLSDTQEDNVTYPHGRT